MRSIFIRLVFVLLLCGFSFICLPQTRITSVYLSQIGVREATGRNDGRSVEMYLRAVNQRAGAPWCAAFVRWCLDSAGIKTNITAWSPSAHNSRAVVWMAGRFRLPAEPGDVFTIYYPRLRRIGHTGFYHKMVNDKIYKSVEGNTNEAGSREGDGVYLKYRSFRATHSITRWR